MGYGCSAGGGENKTMGKGAEGYRALAGVLETKETNPNLLEEEE